MLTAANFAEGDQFICVYNGKPRVCRVEKMDPRWDYMLVATQDGPRNFKFDKIRSLETVALVEDLPF